MVRVDRNNERSPAAGARLSSDRRLSAGARADEPHADHGILEILVERFQNVGLNPRGSERRFLQRSEVSILPSGAGPTGLAERNGGPHGVTPAERQLRCAGGAPARRGVLRP